MIKDALLAHRPQETHMLLNSGALLSYRCRPSALSGSRFSSVGSLIAVTEYLAPRAQLSPFLSKTKQSSSMYGSYYSTVGSPVSRNWLCVCRHVFKESIDNTKPHISSFFRQKLSLLAPKITIRAPDWIAHSKQWHLCDCMSRHACQSLKILRLIVTPTHFCCDNILWLSFPVITSL